MDEHLPQELVSICAGYAYETFAESLAKAEHRRKFTKVLYWINWIDSHEAWLEELRTEGIRIVLRDIDEEEKRREGND